VFQSNLDQELSKSQDSLAAKLDARRKRKEQAETARLEKSAQLEEDQELKAELSRRQQEESLLGPSMADTAGQGRKPSAPHISG
jgi:hypothetical protein